MAIVETPDDARVGDPAARRRLCLAPQWDAQKAQFGPARRIRYVLLDQRRLRGHVQTLPPVRPADRSLQDAGTETRGEPQRRPADRGRQRLVLGPAGRGRVPEMQEAGHRAHPLEPPQRARNRSQRMNDMGVLTSRYDIYQDVMNPANFPKLGYVHPDWTTRGLAQRPDHPRGWHAGPAAGACRARTASGIPAACSATRRPSTTPSDASPRNWRRIPYRCRFIDTTTAAAWRECYHPEPSHDAQREPPATAWSCWPT